MPVKIDDELRALIQRTWDDPENQRMMGGWNFRERPTVVLPIISRAVRPDIFAREAEAAARPPRTSIAFTCEQFTIIQGRETLHVAAMVADGVIVDCWPKQFLSPLRGAMRRV